jgi:hypothetical protein
MPFLYQLIYAKLQGKEGLNSDKEEEDGIEDDPAEMLCHEGENLESFIPDNNTNEEPPLHPEGPIPPPKEPLIILENEINEFEGGFLLGSPDCNVRRKLQ